MSTPDAHSGMTRREDMTADERHVQDASTFACGKCGKAFPSAEAVYDHLDAEHPRRARDRGR